MSAFKFAFHNPRPGRFLASASVAALIASVTVGAMEMYVWGPTDIAAFSPFGLRSWAAPSLAKVVGENEGALKLA